MKGKFLLITFIFSLNLNAQKKDYLKIRDQLGIAHCGIADSAQLIQRQGKLLGVDTLQISKNLDQYYYDHGMCYFTWVVRGDSSRNNWKLAILNFEKSASHKRTASALWQCAFCALLSGECEKGLAYMDQYRRIESKKRLKVKAAQINDLLSECS